MSDVTPARRAALNVLREVGRGRRLDRAFAAHVRDLPPRDRRFVQEVAYGTVRLRGRIDHLLALHLRKGLGGTPPDLVDVLRLAAYQLLHLDGVPGYAALSQAVEQAREVSPGMAGLANGVLRSLLREGGGPERFPDPQGDPAGFLSAWGSHPRWLVDRWLARWPFEEVSRLVEANNAVPPVFLRSLGVSAEEATERLRAAGIEPAPGPPGSPCLRLPDGVDPAAVLTLVRGVIQDPAAALVPLFADPEPGILAVDLCAAPGGKALALAERASYVVAADRSASRLRLLRENVERLGAGVGVVAGLAERAPLASAPFLLLDVPCTGTGTLRRHPDGRWRLEPRHVRELAALQERILEGAAPLVPPGGLLVYATCTLEPEENDEQVERFLSRHPDFRDERPTGAPGGVAEWLDDRGRLRVLPQQSGFDGAFAARLRRAG